MQKQLNLFDPEPTLVAPTQGQTPTQTESSSAVSVPVDHRQVLSFSPKSAEAEPVAHEKSAQKDDGQKKSGCATHWKLFVDGAARNNPGPAGAGFYLLKDSAFCAKKGYYLGSRTNNQAEYLALLLGLHFLKNYVKPGDCVHIVSDSQLLVRQLQGEYRIKAVELKPFHALASALMQVIHAQIFHVLRTDNAQADRMANKGIDTKRTVPEDFITMLHAHGISW